MSLPPTSQSYSFKVPSIQPDSQPLSMKQRDIYASGLVWGRGSRGGRGDWEAPPMGGRRTVWETTSSCCRDRAVRVCGKAVHHFCTTSKWWLAEKFWSHIWPDCNFLDCNLLEKKISYYFMLFVFHLSIVFKCPSLTNSKPSCTEKSNSLTSQEWWWF